LSILQTVVLTLVREWLQTHFSAVLLTSKEWLVALTGTSVAHGALIT
jgi:hypothetical protein